MPVASASARSASSASLWWTPPPATTSGRRAARTAVAAAATSAASGAGRRTCQTRSAKNSSGQSYASACTSCGSASVTAPVSAGSASTRIACERGGDQRLGAVDPVEVAGDGPQRVVDGHVARVRHFELLEHGVGGAGGEGVAGEQQHRAAG